jgi:hypothetical protein
MWTAIIIGVAVFFLSLPIYIVNNALYYKSEPNSFAERRAYYMAKGADYAAYLAVIFVFVMLAIKGILYLNG